jgi:hypothetical protein
MGDLQGHLVIERKIKCEKNPAHAPASQQFQETVPGAEILWKRTVRIRDEAGDAIPQRLTFTGHGGHG